MEKSSILKAVDVDDWENGGNVNRRWFEVLFALGTAEKQP